MLERIGIVAGDTMLLCNRDSCRCVCVCVSVCVGVCVCVGV